MSYLSLGGELATWPHGAVFGRPVVRPGQALGDFGVLIADCLFEVSLGEPSGVREISFPKLRPLEVCAPELRPLKVGTLEIGSLELRAGEVGALEVRGEEARFVEIGSAEGGMLEVGCPEHGQA